MKECPTCKRTYSDETLSFCLADGALLSAPYDPRETLIVPAPHEQPPSQHLPVRDEAEVTLVKREVDSSTARATSDIAEVVEPVMAINVNQQYPHVQSPEDLYNCTRGIWRIDRQHASKAEYAFAVYKGVIKEVYKIDRWIPASEATLAYWGERERAQGKSFPPEVHAGRSEFIGEVAPETIRKKYVGKRVPLRPAQSSTRYINC